MPHSGQELDDRRVSTLDRQAGAQRPDSNERPAQGLSVAAFLPLPVEIIRYIMEIAARGSMTTALSLLLVSKAVHEWMMNIIYRAVVLGNRHQVEHFHRAVTAATFNSVGHVRNLSLFYDHLPEAMGLNILRRCTHVQRLVTASEAAYFAPRGPVALPSDSWPQPWEIILLNQYQDWSILTSIPFFSTVTHLHYDTDACRITINPDELCRALPHLTHLGFTNGPNYFDDYSLLAIKCLLLSKLPLKMLIVHDLYWEVGPTQEFVGRFWVELARIGDERLLARPAFSRTHFNQLLESGQTVWDHAKEMYGNWRSLVREHPLH